MPVGKQRQTHLHIIITVISDFLVSSSRLARLGRLRLVVLSGALGSSSFGLCRALVLRLLLLWGRSRGRRRGARLATRRAAEVLLRDLDCGLSLGHVWGWFDL